VTGANAPPLPQAHGEDVEPQGVTGRNRQAVRERLDVLVSRVQAAGPKLVRPSPESVQVSSGYLHSGGLTMPTNLGSMSSTLPVSRFRMNSLV